MSRTRYEPAREVPFTPTELTYLSRLIERDLKAIRGDKNQWDSPASTVLVERVQTKISRVLNRQAL